MLPWALALSGGGDTAPGPAAELAEPLLVAGTPDREARRPRPRDVLRLQRRAFGNGILRRLSRSSRETLASRRSMSLRSSVSTARTSRSRKPRPRSAEKSLAETSSAWGYSAWP